MTIEEFEDLVDRHGEDLSTWPIEERASASAMLEQSPEAREIMREAQLLRRGLPSTPIRAPGGLAAQIFARAEPASPQRRRSEPWAAAFGRFCDATFRLRPEFVLVACFVIGFVASLLPPEPKAPTRSTLDLPTLFSRSLR